MSYRETLIAAFVLVVIIANPLKSPTMGKPWATIISKVQAPFQSFFRPAVWVPGIRNLHSHHEKWNLQSDSNKTNLEAVLSAITKVISEGNNGAFWDVRKQELEINSAFIQVFVYTRAEWLDIIEIRLKGKTAEVWAFSSGFLPLIIPFACIVNLPLFWVPFLDMGMNKHRINKIVDAMDIPVERIS